MTKILAIDTSTHACSAALYIDGCVEERYKYAPRLHGELLLDMVDDLLSSKHITLDAIDALAYGCGPGSFTGVRMAASVMQGLVLGVQKPVIAVSSLLALADGLYQCLGYGQIACAFDARMNEVYWAAYQFSNGEWVAAVPDCVIAPEQISSLPQGDWVGVGDGWTRYAQELGEKTGIKDSYARFYPHAANIASLAASRYLQGDYQEVAFSTVLPVYLRNKVV
ncbi:MAG: tRNA (adenosine(37)-N6)-threonylcarbamoyltransferase complex dimerization subunit type 1 TsaB [Gammaproteobacteria bacterium]